MNLWTNLFDLIVLLSVAMVLGVLAERLKQSAVVGYMIAGVIVGNAGGALDDKSNVETLANLGVILLLFTIGLEFNWSRLKRLGLTALIAGSLQIGLTIAVGMVLSVAAGMMMCQSESFSAAQF